MSRDPLSSALILAALVVPVSAAALTLPGAQDAPPRVLLDQSPRAIEYQLGRLTNDELARVERQPGDAKYRLVYYAILTRKGMPKNLRDESLGVLTKIDGVSRSQMLLQALGKVKTDEDQQTGDQLLELLLAQPAEALRGQRDLFVKAASDAQPLVRSAAYGAMMIGDADPAAAWQAADKDGHIVDLLRAVAALGKADDVRAKLFAPLSALVSGSQDAATRAAAITAISFSRKDAAAFELIARELDPARGADPLVRAAAVASLRRIPESAWPKAGLETVARGLLAMLKETPADRRTEPDAVSAVQLGEALAAALPDEAKRGILRDLRSLGVRIIAIDTVPEQILYDRKWFVVEAGKPVQIVLFNPDTMPHNVVVGQPGSVKEIGTAGASVMPTADPNAKAYVPDSPLVLAATRLLNSGETARLNFTAPAKPGEYVYLCSFPGHWLRMYGVMLVVDNLDAWEATPTEPKDPLTGEPMGAQKR